MPSSWVRGYFPENERHTLRGEARTGADGDGDSVGYGGGGCRYTIYALLKSQLPSIFACSVVILTVWGLLTGIDPIEPQAPSNGRQPSMREVLALLHRCLVS